MCRSLVETRICSATPVACVALDRVLCRQSPMFGPVNNSLKNNQNFLVVKMRESYQTVIAKAERRMGQDW